MSNISKLKEKQVEEQLDRLVGSADPALRQILKLTMTNTEVTDEIKHILNEQQKANLYEAVCLEQELEMTMDARGNIVPVNGGVEKTIVMGGSAPSAIETSNHRKPDGYKSINFSGAIIIHDDESITTANA
tara:strand:+ start:1646 stop:2038 length:393 start_codon:yes stop_codon:yes gene_type:complete